MKQQNIHNLKQTMNRQTDDRGPVRVKYLSENISLKEKIAIEIDCSKAQNHEIEFNSLLL